MPAPPRPPAGRRPGSTLVAGTAAVLVLAAGGLAGCDRGSPPPPAAVSWEVGSCIWVSQEFPHPTPSDPDPELRRLVEQSKEYQTVACDDPRAVATITGLGGLTEGPVEDTGCPDDTDLAVQQRDILGRHTESQIYCARNLHPPHPGDPGGGGGGIVVGDCVWVLSSSGVEPLNDIVLEAPCAEDSFAVVLAEAADAGDCPEGTLSRVSRPIATDTTLCLGEGSDTRIAQPGDCVFLPGNLNDPVLRERCEPLFSYTLAGFAESPDGCPEETSGERFIGYDRYLCLRLTTD